MRIRLSQAYKEAESFELEFSTKNEDWSEDISQEFVLALINDGYLSDDNTGEDFGWHYLPDEKMFIVLAYNKECRKERK